VSWLTVLNREVVGCTRCPRLVAYREQVAREKRRAYRDWEYWGKPVPGFGDPDARVLIMGLAPGAHGSNRTGRPFTGDASGNFMYPVLYETGFASQPTATNRNDGLKLKDLYITAAVRCAPPANKPTPEERDACLPYFARELELLRNVQVIVVLGAFAYEAVGRVLVGAGSPLPTPRPRFTHLLEVPTARAVVLGCFHPSQQNTFTGKLTEPMIDEVFLRARAVADGVPSRP
jgi:uracil-DNA glycosylase family 4